MIKFERVSKLYPGGSRALADVSFAIERGSMVFLTGHSGAGKSTLLRLVMMLERASRGQVIVDGRNLSKAPDRLAPLVRRNTGMIFQDHKLLKDKTVADNVALPLMIAGLKYSDIRKRVRAALDMVGLLEKEKAWPLTLSGGEQQRVGIARAFANEPRVLFADEPTGNLDRATGQGVVELLLELNRERGATLVVVTHDLELARCANRIVHIAGGRVERIEAGSGASRGTGDGGGE
jgi:cell division transport system ATP-binding protein